MKINFTKKQYRTLVRLVYLGEIMLNDPKSKDKIEQEAIDLELYINSFAKEFSSLDLFWENDEGRLFFDDREDDEETNIKDKYDAIIFWKELTDCLLKKSLEKSFPEGENEENREAFSKERDRIMNLVLNEFSTNGLQNLQLNIAL